MFRVFTGVVLEVVPFIFFGVEVLLGKTFSVSDCWNLGDLLRPAT